MSKHAFVKKTAKRGRPKASALCKVCGVCNEDHGKARAVAKKTKKAGKKKAKKKPPGYFSGILKSQRLPGHTGASRPTPYIPSLRPTWIARQQAGRNPPRITPEWYPSPF